MEVAHDHTFTVGAGQWVVHNCTAFPNRLPGELSKELQLAQDLGVKPIKVGDPGFQEMVQSGGTVKWAVTTDWQLAFVPKFVNGQEIAHTVITGGQDVLAAGEAQIVNRGVGWEVIYFDN